MAGAVGWRAGSALRVVLVAVMALVLGAVPGTGAAARTASPPDPPARQATDFFVPVEGSPAAREGGHFSTASPVPAGETQAGLVAVYDLSAVGNSVKTVVRASDGCTRSGDRITCVAGDGRLSDRPFQMTAHPSAPLGYAGVITVRFTGRPDLPPTARTRIHIGVPEFHTAPFAGVTMLPTSARGTPPPVRPAFVNTGGPTPGTVVLRISVADILPTRENALDLGFPLTFGNCHYAELRTHAYCEFRGPLRPGQGYTTDAEFRAVNKKCCQTEGFYDYTVTPLEQLSHSEIATYRAMRKGSGPTLGLKETDASALTGPVQGRAKFRSDDVAVGVYFHQRSVTIDGKVGGGAAFEVLRPTVTDGFPATVTEVRVELPEGISLAPAPEPGEFPSEEGWCNRDDLTRRTLVCGVSGSRTMLAVRIDREVPGAQGKVSVPVPPGDTEPADNSMLVKVVVTGVMKPPVADRPGHWVAAAVVAVLATAGGAAALVVRRRRSAAARAGGGPAAAR